MNSYPYDFNWIARVHTRDISQNADYVLVIARYNSTDPKLTFCFKSKCDSKLITLAVTPDGAIQ